MDETVNENLRSELKEETDFKGVLTLQLKNISYAMTAIDSIHIRQRTYQRGVDCFEDLLEPFKDKEYLEDSEAFDTHRSKFRALIRLAHRRGLLLKEKETPIKE